MYASVGFQEVGAIEEQVNEKMVRFVQMEIFPLPTLGERLRRFMGGKGRRQPELATN